MLNNVRVWNPTVFLTFFFLLLWPQSGFSATQTELSIDTIELSIDTKVGAAFIENTTKEKLKTSLMFGMGTSAGYHLTSRNLLHLSLYYMKPLNAEVSGTEQVQVSHKMQILNPLVQYEFRCEKIGFIASIGPSLGIVTTEFSLYELNTPYLKEGKNADPQIVFPNKTRTYKRDESGIEIGVVINSGIAVDIGAIVGFENDFFRILLNHEYIRRGGRNEFYTWFAFSITPTSLSN